MTSGKPRPSRGLSLLRTLLPRSAWRGQWRRLGVALLLLGVVPVAQATLGSDLTSVRADQKKLDGSLRIQYSGAYEVHEIRAAGAVVREYVAGGTVFGLAWQGAVIPDLRQLLGRYYQTYIQAVRAQLLQRRGLGPISVQLPDLVVLSTGHMRAFTGRAYLPAMLPPGVHAEAVR